MLMSQQLIAEEIEAAFGYRVNDPATDELSLNIRQNVEELPISWEVLEVSPGCALTGNAGSSHCDSFASAANPSPRII
jgi:hypothetical protein